MRRTCHGQKAREMEEGSNRGWDAVRVRVVMWDSFVNQHIRKMPMRMGPFVVESMLLKP